MTGSYTIIGMLGLVACVLTVASWYFQSEVGVYTFALAFGVLLIAFAMFAGEKFKTYLSGVERGELHMLPFGIIVGTSIGLLACSVILLTDAARFSFALMLFCALFVPIFAMLLERVGLIEAFDRYELFDE